MVLVSRLGDNKKSEELLMLLTLAFLPYLITPLVRAFVKKEKQLTNINNKTQKG